MRFWKVSLTTCVLALLGTSAKADFLPVLDTSPPMGTPSDVFTYSLNFTTGVDTGNGGVPNATLTTGSQITIYDFIGLTTASQVNLVGPFTFTIQMTGLTPSGLSPTDSATIANITIIYTGATLTADTSFSDALTITDSGYLNTVLGVGEFTSTETKASGPLAGSLIKSLGNVSLPRAVPEPASLALMGLGLVGALAIRRRTR